MVATMNDKSRPFGLVITGEAETWQNALDQIVGPDWLRTYRVSGGRQLLELVDAGLADAAVLDESMRDDVDVMQMLRLIRRTDAMLPVVLVTSRRDRRSLEDAMRLAAFSVVARPIELEELLRQIWRMMARLDQMMRMGRER